MQDAQYFRARAEFCRQLADQLSDRAAATRVRCLAAEYASRAARLEAADAAAPPSTPSPGKAGGGS